MAVLCEVSAEELAQIEGGYLQITLENVLVS
jgi:bacteriocin-like protein